jgi:hypothetical protein
MDRRQPTLRWSAVFAGAACSIGFWMLLQLLGLGIDLAAVDVDNARSVHGVGLGTTVWSLVSPLIAMFLGGLVTGKLAHTHDRKHAAGHGLIMWAITSIVGLCASLWIVTMIAAGAARDSGAAIDPTGNLTSIVDGRGESLTLSALGTTADDLLAPINQRLADQHKPTITVWQFEAALRGVVRTGFACGDFDQELLVDQLVVYTRLSRADAVEVERQVEACLDGNDKRPHQLERRLGRYALCVVDAIGKALVTVGLSLLLSLLTSVIGAMVVLGRSRRTGGNPPHHSARDTSPGYLRPIEPATTTAPYPSLTAGLPMPVLAPNDFTS